MATRIATAEKVRYEERQRQVTPRQAEAEEEAQTGDRLTLVEKAAFGVAAVFSAVILVICVLLTVVGFIFSPITDTLVFGLLMGATGLTSYVIWRGGRRNAG